jgi:hypothetical protein
VNWIKKYFEAIDKYYTNNYDREVAWGKGGGIYGGLMAEANAVLKNQDTIIKMFKNKLENEMNSKIKIMENGETRKTMQNFRNGMKDAYGVNVLHTLTNIFNELGLPLNPLRHINPHSTVAPDYYAGLCDLPDCPSVMCNLKEGQLCRDHKFEVFRKTIKEQRKITGEPFGRV